MELGEIYRLMTLILGFGLTIKALETLYLLPEFGRRGLLDYAIAGNDLFALGRSAQWFARIYSPTGVLLMAAATVPSFAVLLMSNFGSVPYQVAVLTLIVSNVALYYRQGFGLDGADQMALLILLTVLICSVFVTDAAVMRVGLWFIALQLALSYFVSGFAKLLSREWRGGLALRGILSTYTYGTRFSRQLLTRFRPLSLIGCWAVIGTELILPLALVLDGVPLLVLMGLGLAMHLGIAVVMGLNDFVWSFGAAYPALYFVTTVV